MNEFPIDIIRSERRKKSVSASLRDGRVKVMAPEGLDPDEESRLIDDVVARVIRKATSAEVDLAERTRLLASRYELPTPVEVEWSERQKQRWGSCNPREGRIRVSNRLALMPTWVLDWVLVHEMAHLEVPDHGPHFQEMANRYELAERATGYLMAISGHGAVDF